MTIETGNRQAGVTLLLSVMILSGLTLITITVATFAVQELRSSRAIIITEPAIAAAESAGEQGLWSLKRSGTLSTCPTTDNRSLTNNTYINACKSYDEATITIQGGTPYEIFLYNPDNKNGDIDLSDFPYSEITVLHVSGSTSLSVTVERLDGSLTGILPSVTTGVNQGDQAEIDISPVPVTSPETEGRLKITLESIGDVTVTVNTDRGMPTFPTVDAFACSSRIAVSNCNNPNQEIFSRRINITVPQ